MNVRRTRRVKRPFALPKVTRDAVLFFTGLTLAVNESLIRSGPERPSLIILYAGMMGLPIVLRADEFRSAPEEDEPPPPSPHGRQ